MVSVTQRVRAVKQPRGGYIPPSSLETRFMGRPGQEPIDASVENVHPSLVSLAVDYLTRVALGRPATESFKIAVAGAGRLGEEYATYAQALCDIVDGYVHREMQLPDNESARFLVIDEKDPRWYKNGGAFRVPDDEAIRAAIRLASFDVVMRAGKGAYSPHTNLDPDEATLRNIGRMLANALRFAWEYGPVVVIDFTTLGGYSETVNAGDGDYVTVDTLWDMKVSTKPPTRENTLQVLMYWLMARRSDWNWHPTWNWGHTTSEADWREAWDLDKYLKKHRTWPDDLHGPVPGHIGIFNPRLETVYRLRVEDIPEEVIDTVEREVLCYAADSSR